MGPTRCERPRPQSIPYARRFSGKCYGFSPTRNQRITRAGQTPSRPKQASWIRQYALPENGVKRVLFKSRRRPWPGWRSSLFVLTTTCDISRRSPHSHSTSPSHEGAKTLGQGVCPHVSQRGGHGLQQRPCRGPFRPPFRDGEASRQPDGHPTSIPQDDQKRPGTTRTDRKQKRLLGLGFGRFSLVSGHLRNGWC